MALGTDVRPLALLVAMGCGSSPPPVPPQLRIVATSGGQLQAVAGDALSLKVVVVAPDGSTSALTEGATVQWTSPATIETLPSVSSANDPLPATGAEPAAVWIDNAQRTDRGDDLFGVLMVIDPGTAPRPAVQVAAAVSGGPMAGTVTASVALGPVPAGDASRGAAVFGANCAPCHGPTGHGSPADANGVTYTLEGDEYAFPAPAIDGAQGRLASDPTWSPALLAVAARADMDNHGVALRIPMPDWLSVADAAGKPPTTQDFADVYAFLKTQTR